jgi:hypothetical protein
MTLSGIVDGLQGGTVLLWALGILVTIAAIYVPYRRARWGERFQQRQSEREDEANLKILRLSVREEHEPRSQGLWLGVDVRNVGKAAATNVEVLIKERGPQIFEGAVIYRTIEPGTEVFLSHMWGDHPVGTGPVTVLLTVRYSDRTDHVIEIVVRVGAWDNGGATVQIVAVFVDGEPLPQPGSVQERVPVDMRIPDDLWPYGRKPKRMY